MKLKKTLLGATLALSGFAAQAAPDLTVINTWDYINEAGFIGSQTGYADAGTFSDESIDDAVSDIPGGTTTLDPDTLEPISPTGVVTPPGINDDNYYSYKNNGDIRGVNVWVQNPLDGLYYNYGIAGGVSGSSATGSTAGAAGQGTDSILELFDPLPIADSICWGYGPSCLKFENEDGDDTSRVEGIATTTGFNQDNIWNQGTVAVHQNSPTGAPSLTNVNLVDGLHLFSDVLDNAFKAPELVIPILFNETFNPEGSDPFFDYAPDDAFILDLSVLAALPANASVNFGPDFLDFALDITLKDSDFAAGVNPDEYHKTYQVVTRLSGLQVLEMPDSSQTYAILTEENSSNFLNAQFAIRAVPEPTPLVVLGAGLLLMAFRRKKASL